MDLYKYTIVSKQNDILYLIKRTDRQPEREKERDRDRSEGQRCYTNIGYNIVHFHRKNTNRNM